LKVSDGKGIFWFGYDFEPEDKDNVWFFAYQPDGDNALPEPFNIDKCWWHGEKYVKYRYIGEVLGEGIDFNTLDLPSMTTQKVAKKLLEWQA
jgi:hypothetical protein